MAPARPASLRGRLPADFLRDIFKYAGSQIALKGIDVVSFSIALAALTNTQFAFWGLSASLTVVVVDVLSAGVLRTGVPRYISEGLLSYRDAYRVGVSVVSVLAVGLPLVFALAPDALFAGMKFPGYRPYFVLLSVLLCTRAFFVMNTEILRMMTQVTRQAIVEPIPGVLNLVLVLACLPYAHDRLEALLLIQIAANLPTTIYFLWTNRTNLGFDLRPALGMMSYSGPVTLQRMMDEISSSGDRWIVLFTLGVDAAAAYSFLYRVGDLMKLMIMPLQKAFNPQLLKSVLQGTPRQVEKLGLTYTALSFAAFLVSIPFSILACYLIDATHRFTAQYSIAILVVFAHYCFQAYGALGIGFYVKRKAAEILPITLTSLGINLVLSWTLASSVGLWAVPIATVVSNLVLAALSYAFGRKLYDYPSPAIPVLTSAGLAIGLGLTLLAATAVSQRQAWDLGPAAAWPAHLLGRFAAPRPG